MYILKIILIIVIIIIVRVLYNLLNFLEIKKYESKYLHYLNHHNEWYITENRQKIVGLFKKAGVGDSYVGHVKPVGFNHIQTANISVFDNLPALTKDIAQIVGAKFVEAKGTFKNRVLESFNPIFWIENIVFLPRNLLVYLGLDAEKVFVKVAQILWWMFGVFKIFLEILRSSTS